MNATSLFARLHASIRSARLPSAWASVASASLCLALAACGGSADAPPPPESGPPPPAAVAPTITLQPQPVAVTVGQPASFSVAASGTQPIGFQWQRNGTPIAGATSTTYAIAATTLADTGAIFRAVASNVAGSATSNTATLTVTAVAPVLTIAPQPASVGVAAGATATFTVGGTCSSGTLAIQWQRNTGAAGALANIAGAIATTFSLTTALADNGAQFRAALDCSGQAATTSGVATLTVTAPGAVTLGALPINGLRAQAQLFIVAGIDQDAAGNFSFISSNQVKRLSADLGTITDVAGTALTAGSTDGAATPALFNGPTALTHDAAGVLYVADTGNHTIRRIAVDGTVSTLAGSAGMAGSADGTGSAARFSQPSGIALGPDGDLYVADRGNHRIRRVTTAGAVTVYAGSVVGILEGPALAAQFSSPSDVAVAANGDVLVADSGNSRVRRILRAGNLAGLVETLAGGSNAPGNPDGIGAAATLRPVALVVRGNTLTVRDNFGLLRQVDLTTTAVTTLAGSRTLGAGYADGTTTTGRLGTQGGVTAGAGGVFLLADAGSRALRVVSPAGAVRTIASGFAAGFSATGTGVLAQMPFSSTASTSDNLQSVTVSPPGNAVIVERQTGLVRRISSAGDVTLVAGLTHGTDGPVDGTGSEAQFAFGFDAAIASDSAGVLYVGDSFGVRRIGLDNATTLLAGSRTTAGGVDGNATTARFGSIQGLAVKPAGDLYVTDTNGAVRRIDAAGNVSTYAGLMGALSRIDGPIAAARFGNPGQLAFLPDGSLLVVDKLGGIDGVIRKVASDGSSVSTLALPANSQVTALAVDAAGTVYYGSGTNGLVMIPVAGAPVVLVRISSSVQLGTMPSVPSVEDIAVLGTKQLVILAQGQILKVTLP